MGDSHRRFLQTMMGCAVLTGREAESLHRYCCEAHNSEPFTILSNIVTSSNKINLSNLQQHVDTEKRFDYIFHGLINVFVFRNIKVAKWINHNPPHLLWWYVLSFSMIFRVIHYSVFSAAQYVPNKLDDFINTINSKLQPLFMQIRKGMSEDSGEQCYALVSELHFSTGPHLSGL